MKGLSAPKIGGKLSLRASIRRSSLSDWLTSVMNAAAVGALGREVRT